MDNILVPKSSTQFVCYDCDYITSRESQYKRHLSTAKHQKITNGNNLDPLACKHCFQTFKYRSGLSRHLKKCVLASPKQLEPNTKTENLDISKGDILMILQQNQELLTSNQEFKQLMIEQSKQIHEQQQENQELQKQLLEVVKEGKTINNTQNNKFNLNFFLNEQCKDAINMSEFMENLTLDMEDLTETGRLGFVNGISRIFVNKLRELDMYKRPLHCTDLKRETLYIRENDEWSKEENSKDKLRELVNRVANKNCKTMQQWTAENPNYTEMDSMENKEFMKLSDAVLGGFGEHESKQFRDKIIRSVIKEVFVCKN